MELAIYQYGPSAVNFIRAAYQSCFPPTVAAIKDFFRKLFDVLKLEYQDAKEIRNAMNKLDIPNYYGKIRA